MSMMTPAPQQPEISSADWVGDPEQCPKWVGFPTRASLPAGLIWSGSREIPAIGARVYIHMNSYGLAEVKAYFHADGYVGVICQPDQMPARLSAHGVTLGHFFGRELEPYQPGRHAPAMVPEVLEIEGPPSLKADKNLPLMEDAQEPAAMRPTRPPQKENADCPGLNRSDDWIPDYPPQEDDELSDDDQDHDEHPEHPQDEQRD